MTYPGQRANGSTREEGIAKALAAGEDRVHSKFHERPSTHEAHTWQKPPRRDEFDGPCQHIDPGYTQSPVTEERDLLHLPVNLTADQQDGILNQVNDCLCRCAFDFMARYQFPIPREPEKRLVHRPADREWNEWAFLLKRLASRRRIPRRVLYGGRIKQFGTVLDNSLEMRHAAKHQSRPLKDDRNVLQLISAGLQVAQILKDGHVMETLDEIYTETEDIIQQQAGRKS